VKELTNHSFGKAFLYVPNVSADAKMNKNAEEKMYISAGSRI
jgi:hypothetical protein